jgi:ubiquitin-conjugating enzyme E2 O
MYGLFFFDLQLPPSYPAEPPLVNYRSFGLHVNPNLYPSGTVCLSLINTFGGQHKAEIWSPEASTILQVVVSIQGLVLIALPYYNEPAWARAGSPMGQRNELPYSESIFLQSLQTMLHLLRRPPAGFEEFVRDHFRRRGQHVIQACEAYRDGCLVGTLDEEGNPMEGSREWPCSAGFRIVLEPRLGSASGPTQLAVRASRRLHGPRSTEHTHQGLGLTQPKRLA